MPVVSSVEEANSSSSFENVFENQEGFMKVLDVCLKMLIIILKFYGPVFIS